MKFHLLTNTNSLLQEKMRFFADYFSFTNEFLGRIPELPYENGHSLITKILYQIRNNRKHCIVYIENYFAQLLCFYQYEFVNKTDIYNSVKRQVEEMQSYSAQGDKTPKLTWLNDNPDFEIGLEALLKECDNEFESSLENIYTMLVCNHKLDEHIVQLKYCTHLIVSEFRLKGHSQESVAKYIDRLLKKDVPLPPEILSITNELERKQRTEEYLQEEVFKVQLYGLRNILLVSIYQSGYFIYLIKDAFIDNEIKDNFIVHLDKVTFISANHSQLKNLKTDFLNRYAKSNNDLTPKFFETNYLFAYLQLNYDKVEIAQQIGLDIVKQELKQLNQYLCVNLSVDNRDFLFSKEISAHIDSFRYGLGTNNDNRIQALFAQNAEENIFEQLRNIQSQAKEKILNSESIFLKAFSNDEVSAYWNYIESLFWNTEYEGLSNIKKIVAKILSKSIEKEKISLVSSIIAALRDIYFFGDPTKSIGLDDEEVQYITHEIFNKHNFNFNFNVYKKKILNPFLKNSIHILKNFYSNSQMEKWKIFYSTLVLELYEYRNLEFHSGKALEVSKRKLLADLPFLITRLRWFFVDYTKANPQLSFSELIKVAIN